MDAWVESQITTNYEHRSDGARGYSWWTREELSSEKESVQQEAGISANLEQRRQKHKLTLYCQVRAQRTKSASSSQWQTSAFPLASLHMPWRHIHEPDLRLATSIPVRVVSQAIPLPHSMLPGMMDFALIRPKCRSWNLIKGGDVLLHHHDTYSPSHFSFYVAQIALSSLSASS